MRLALRCSAAAPTRARPDLSPSDRALSFLPGVRWDPDLAGDFQALARAPEGRAALEEVLCLADECVSTDDADALEAAVVKLQVALHRPLRAVMPRLAAGGRKPRAIYSAEIATAKRAWRRELARRRAGSHVHVRRLKEYRRLLKRRHKELALRSGHHVVAIARASMCAFWKTCWRAGGRKAKSVPGITLEQWHDYFRDLLGAPRHVRRDAAGAALAARAARGEQGGSSGAGTGAATCSQRRGHGHARARARGGERGAVGARRRGWLGRSWDRRDHARRSGHGRALACGEASPGSANASGVDYERVFDAGEVAAGIAALNSGSKRNKAVLGFVRPEFLARRSSTRAPA
jgi:hypothetical protein